MMRGGTLLILGHGVKGQGQLWHSVYNALWAQYIPRGDPGGLSRECVLRIPLRVVKPYEMSMALGVRP